MAYFLAFAAGLVAAFFVVFNSLFSDVSSLNDRAATLVLTTVTYAVLGGVFGTFSRTQGWKWGLWVSLPAIVLVALYSTHEPERLLLHLLYLSLALGPASLAAYIASRRR